MSLDLDPARVELGRALFHDLRLSRGNQVSCASCHPIDQGGADGRRVSVGVDGAEGSVNAPTVLNSAFNFRQFWDGRAGTLEE
jgi:cytochrome c peroxidase